MTVNQGDLFAVLMYKQQFPAMGTRQARSLAKRERIHHQTSILPQEFSRLLPHIPSSELKVQVDRYETIVSMYRDFQRFVYAIPLGDIGTDMIPPDKAPLLLEDILRARSNSPILPEDNTQVGEIAKRMIGRENQLFGQLAEDLCFVAYSLHDYYFQSVLEELTRSESNDRVLVFLAQSSAVPSSRLLIDSLYRRVVDYPQAAAECGKQYVKPIGSLFLNGSEVLLRWSDVWKIYTREQRDCNLDNPLSRRTLTLLGLQASQATTYKDFTVYLSRRTQGITDTLACLQQDLQEPPAHDFLDGPKDDQLQSLIDALHKNGATPEEVLTQGRAFVFSQVINEREEELARWRYLQRSAEVNKGFLSDYLSH